MASEKAPEKAEAPEDKYVIGPNGEKRLKGVQLAIPVVTGSLAFWLGKKATEHQTHKWHVYLRSPTGEDLSHVIKKVSFELHSSFPEPIRDIDYPPYELAEAGWGEFDIIIRLHFTEDAACPPLELYHRLNLGLNENGVGQKKPVLHEMYEEAVLWEPPEAFYQRVKAHVPRAAPPSQLAQYFLKYNPPADYQRIQWARQRLAQATAHVKAQLAALDAEEGGQGGGAGGGGGGDVEMAAA